MDDAHERVMGLAHVWHQTQGDAFARAMVCALGRIEWTVRAFEKMEAEEGVQPVPDCEVCQRTCARPFAGILLDLAETLRDCSAWPDRSALHAALRARNAVIEGDTGVVDTFSRTWLDMPRPVPWREAVEMALLGEWVHMLGDGTADTLTLVSVLRYYARTEHRQLQPLWERRVRGKRAVLLSHPVGDGLTLGDLLAEAHGPDEAVLDAEITDTRIVAVLRQLHAQEKAVARGWAYSGDAWDRAARAAGLPESYGERVRRKLKRLGARHAARAAEAAAWKADRA